MFKRNLTDRHALYKGSQADADFLGRMDGLAVAPSQSM